ncbi:MAG TPA: DUF3060 domain-containing protein [Candidatus Agrococcus pullicola]|uniref:DUF3060 domain-containing protein n=1 Tax=Candidatus Agrococcus pullicola TaxID=2838429 RepID=A0A9D2CAT3_9MICO|nr:DUF3060 domain-containing protein [Candidatus Agrococcus pullicola]
MRWLRGVSIAVLVVLFVVLGAYYVTGDFTEPEGDANHGDAVESLPPTSLEAEPADLVFQAWGATVEGSTVTFPSSAVRRDAAVFDCTGWDVVVDGFHDSFVLLGECTSLTALGSHVRVAAERVDDLRIEGSHNYVVASAVEEARLDGPHSTLVADSVERLSGSASFPSLLVGTVGADTSDFTFGTAVVGAGLDPADYGDSFTPELLVAEGLSAAWVASNAMRLAPDATEHECAGESLVVGEGVPDERVLITGTCETVIVAGRVPVRIESADTVILLVNSADALLTDVDLLVNCGASTELEAGAVSALLDSGSDLTGTLDFLGAFASVNGPLDLAWRSGMDATDAVQPEDADPLVGPGP